MSEAAESAPARTRRPAPRTQDHAEVRTPRALGACAQPALPCMVRRCLWMPAACPAAARAAGCDRNAGAERMFQGA